MILGLAGYYKGGFSKIINIYVYLRLETYSGICTIFLLLNKRHGQ